MKNSDEFKATLDLYVKARIMEGFVVSRLIKAGKEDTNNLERMGDEFRDALVKMLEEK